MGKIITYKGYSASLEYDFEDNIFVGEVIGINDSLNFHGGTVKEAEAMFHQSIENYLEMCKKYDKVPDKEYKGTFNVRIDPVLHKKLVVLASRDRKSLNAEIEYALNSFVAEN